MKKVIIIILGIIPLYIHAWTANAEVTAIYSHNGKHIINIDVEDKQCGTVGKFWWSTDDSDAKDMFTLALTAYVSGKKVAVVYNETTPNCFSNGSEATHLVIR